MSGGFQVRDGSFDVVVAAGPRVDLWPSAGVRALSMACAEMGLSVGLFGGDSMRVRGVIPLGGTGGMVVVEDVQGRIHRLMARAIVRVSNEPALPDSFPGWRSPGLLPISTAERLRDEKLVHWDPATAILGTGNRALLFGSSLLDAGVKDVWCLEIASGWGVKRFAGWEVNRRRFEMAGGRLLEARPVSLVSKAPLTWELVFEDTSGRHSLEVARVVAAGPFSERPGVAEHPSGSFLFELEQTAAKTRDRDVEGWIVEEERGRFLAGKIIRALIADLGPRREELDRMYKRARIRLKKYFRHREEPFTPDWQGKWLSVADAQKIRSFRGVPKTVQSKTTCASIECLEEIPCNQCERVCPVAAIQPGRELLEDKCTACGLCLEACPSSAIAMVRSRDEQSTSLLTLPWRGRPVWKKGDFATLLNRRGEALASVRVVGLHETPQDLAAPTDVTQLVVLEVPHHLLWEGRSLKEPVPEATADDAFFSALARSESAHNKVEITLNGERRLVHEAPSVSAALFEAGHARSRDILLCPDGSCGLCQVTIDGVKKLACQEKVHRGMSIRFEHSAGWESEALCPCLGITAEEVTERIDQGDLRSPEAVLSACGIGEGRCHGQLCIGAFRRLLESRGQEDARNWIDWRFPWSEWALNEP